MIRVELAVAAIALIATVAVASAQAQTQTTSPKPTIWDHNGSVMYLVANGPSREFHYQKPRAGMLEVGVRPGSLLCVSCVPQRLAFVCQLFEPGQCFSVFCAAD